MKRQDWASVASDEAVKLRAGGRKRYNARRQFLAQIRQQLLVDLLHTGEIDSLEWGWQTRAAEKLGVSRSTICRDHQEIRRIWLKVRREGRLRKPSDSELQEYQNQLSKFKKFWETTSEKTSDVKTRDCDQQSEGLEGSQTKSLDDTDIRSPIQRIVEMAERLASASQNVASSQNSESDFVPVPRRIKREPGALSQKLFEHFYRCCRF